MTHESSEPMKKIKRVIVAIIGGTVLAIGIALLVLPGPAFLVIPAGLGILAVEFAWARRWLHKAKEIFRKASTKVSPSSMKSEARQAQNQERQNHGGTES